MMSNLCVVSNNVRGLRYEFKRNKIFNTLHEKVKDGVFLLQETHSQPEDEVKWRKEWGSKIYLNHGSSNSRGTMIGFSNNLDVKILNYCQDNDGRIQTCSFTHNEIKYLIINLYNANIESEQVKTLEKLNTMIENCDPHDSKILIGGDFNFIFNKKLDALGGNPSLKLNSISEVTKLINKFDLCDIFRIRNPEKKKCTHFANQPPAYLEDWTFSYAQIC